jgi:hypothetical protein
LERALAISEKVLGPEHPHTATTLSTLALLLQDQGDLALARPLFERALAISEMPFGHSSSIAFFGHGLVPLRPWRELTLNRGRRWGAGAR